MSIRDARTISFGKSEDLQVVYATPASKKSIETMLAADTLGNDGRSNWLWITLPNGDVIFGCFPEGDTFENLREDMV